MHAELNFLRYMDPNNAIHQDILDLIRKGLVQCGVDENTSKPILWLTDNGNAYCEMKLLGD